MRLIAVYRSPVWPEETALVCVYLGCSEAEADRALGEIESLAAIMRVSSYWFASDGANWYNTHQYLHWLMMLRDWTAVRL